MQSASSPPLRTLVPVFGATLKGDLVVPPAARAVVLLALSEGTARAEPNNRRVAALLREAGLATLLLDLLTETEAVVDARTGYLRFDVGLLAQRLAAATEWIGSHPATAGLPVGYLGADTVAAAELVAATRATTVSAVVCRSGRLDLAAHVLGRLNVPTLLIVGGEDRPTLDVNRAAIARLTAECELEVVPGAAHRFEEPGALETATVLARRWFERHLVAAPAS